MKVDSLPVPSALTYLTATPNPRHLSGLLNKREEGIVRDAGLSVEEFKTSDPDPLFALLVVSLLSWKPKKPYDPFSRVSRMTAASMMFSIIYT